MTLLLKLTQKLAQGFTALWARYPNKSSKKDAEKAFKQVVTTPEIEAEVHQGLDWQIPYWQTLEWYHPPYLATYLRKERFRDEKPRQTTTRNPAIVRPLTKAQTTQYDAVTRIQSLIREGKTREDAVRIVGIEQGWISEDQR